MENHYLEYGSIFTVTTRVKYDCSFSYCLPVYRSLNNISVVSSLVNKPNQQNENCTHKT